MAANYGFSFGGQEFSKSSNAGIESDLAKYKAQQAQLQAEAAKQPFNLASMADPWSAHRKEAGDSLSALLANPGGQETSPFFKYMKDTQMNQVKASNAAKGFTNSGTGLMALQDRAAGVASQSFFPLANLYAGLAAGNQNPAAGANAYLNMLKFQNTPLGGGGGGFKPTGKPGNLASTGATLPSPSPGMAAPSGITPYGMPSGGSDWGAYGAPYGYGPSAGAGTGYAVSDYGTTQFQPGGLSSYQGAYDPWGVS